MVAIFGFFSVEDGAVYPGTHWENHWVLYSQPAPCGQQVGPMCCLPWHCAQAALVQVSTTDSSVTVTGDMVGELLSATAIVESMLTRVAEATCPGTH